jgi:FixJ family two-component response regulator
MNVESEKKTAVLVIDDDPAVRDSLKFLFQSVGLQTLTFDSASGFRQARLPEVPSCIVLDVRMPGLGGLDFQIELAKTR